MKQFITNHLKNISGWRTPRKLLAFAVDDYGNIRLKSKKARENLLAREVKLRGRFDHLDALDTRSDYEMLFDILSSVKDKVGNPAIFTPYALSCNTDYEASVSLGNYVPENLDITYTRLSAEDPINYEGAFKMLKIGITERLIHPQFHGREHLNVHLFDALLKDKDRSLLVNLELNSMAGINSHPLYPNVGFNQSFAFWKMEEVELHRNIIADGLNRFKEVYGYLPSTFTPPAQQLHASLYPFIIELGLTSVDKVRATNRHLGEGKYLPERNVMGIQKGENYVTIVRNCVFEPSDSDKDWVNFTFQQIKAAFFWNKPAIVSSHRVNFAGHIDPENRKKGLSALSELLKKVVKTWPDVEFVSLHNLASLIKNDNLPNETDL